MRVNAIFAAAAVTLLSSASPDWSPSALAQGLVIDGETIADAKLLAAAKAEGKIVMHGTRPSESIGPVFEAFQKETGIKIDYVRGPSSKVYERVLAEFAVNKLEFDYADLTDLTLIKEWVSRDVLAAHKVPWHDRIAAEIKHPEGKWYYIARPVMVIGINTAEVAEKDFPKSWKDSLDPKWKGKMGMQSIDVGGSAFSLQAYLKMHVAEDAWPRLAQTEPRLYSAVSNVLTDLVRGRLGIGYLDASSVATQIAAGAPLKMIFPSEGLVGFGVFGNATKTAPRPNAARLWVNYVTSKRGSSLMSTSGAYGTHPDATPPFAAGIKFPPQDKVWTIDPGKWDEITQPWTAEWKDIVAKRSSVQ
jgi:iron(III) transport system substrate-binding protein